MWTSIFMKLLPMAMPYLLDYLIAYIKSSETKYDDDVLTIAQTTCAYLASQKNNNVSIEDAKTIDSRKMIETPKDYYDESEDY